MDTDSKSAVRFVVVAVVVSSLFVPGAVGAGGNDRLSDRDAEKSVESSGGIEYQISVDEANTTAIVEYRNPTGSEVELAGYVLRVDGQRVHEQNFDLSAGEQRIREIDLAPGLNVNRDDHTVTFSTFGGSAQFNFTREIDSAAPGDVPTPYISNVTVADGTIDGEPSAVAEVTVVNPSDQLYSTKLMVHTTGTDGSLYPASVRPGSSRTITVELLDDRGAEIAGEARLYTENLSSEEGAMDQVEFAGQAGAGTQVWNRSYEPVEPTWMNDHYHYENDSYGQSFDEKLSRGEEVGGVPVVYPVAALLVGAIVLRKFR